MARTVRHCRTDEKRLIRQTRLEENDLSPMESLGKNDSSPMESLGKNDLSPIWSLGKNDSSPMWSLGKNDSPDSGNKPLVATNVPCPPPVFDVDNMPDDEFMNELYPLDLEWNVDDLDINWRELDDLLFPLYPPNPTISGTIDRTSSEPVPLMARSSGCIDTESASFPPPPSTILVYGNHTVIATDLTFQRDPDRELVSITFSGAVSERIKAVYAFLVRDDQGTVCFAISPMWTPPTMYASRIGPWTECTLQLHDQSRYSVIMTSTEYTDLVGY